MALNQLGLGLLFTATDAATGVMQRVKNGFSQTRDEAGRFGTRSKEAFKEFAMGAGLMTAGLVGIGALAATIPAAADFGKRIAEIGTLTTETSLNTGFLSEEVLRLNAAYGGGTAAQSKAMYDGISAGAANATEATKLLETSNQLAVAGVTEVGVALDGLTSAMNAYGESFDNAAGFADTMFVAVQKGKTTIPELSGVIGRVAPTASALGIKFTELNAAMAAVTAKGLKTEEAATGIKAALSNLIKPTADADKEAKRLGIDFSAAAVRSKGLAGVLKDVTSSAKFNDDSLSQLFGSVEGLNVALALTAGGGAKFEEALKAMEGKSGAAKKAFEDMAATTAFQGKRFVGLWENAKIAVGRALEPMGAAVLRVANMILDGFNKIPTPIRNFIVQALAAAAAVAAVVGAVMAAKAAFAIGAAAMKTFGISASGGILSAFGPVILIIGAVVAAIVGLKYAIDNNIGGIGDKFNRAYTFIKTTMTALGQLFTDGKLRGDMAEAFLAGDNPAVQFAVDIWLAVKRVVEFFRGIGRGFTAAIDAAKPAFDAFSAALDKLGAALGFGKKGAGDMGAAFDSAGTAGESVGKTIGKIAEVAVAVLTAITEFATGVALVWDPISKSLSSVKTSLGEVGTALGDVSGKVNDLSGSAGSSVSGWQLLGGVIGGSVAVSFQFVASQISATVAVLRDLGKVFSGIIDIFVGTATGDWARVWNGYKSVVYGAVQGMVDMLLGLVQVAADVTDKVNSALGIESKGGEGLRVWRDKMRADFKAAIGVDEYAPSAKAAPKPGMGNFGVSPAVEAIGPTRADVAAGAATSTAAAAAAKAAIGSLPPFIANAVVNLDGEAVGRLVLKAQAGDASRSHAAAPVST